MNAEEPRDLDALPVIYKESVLRILSPELPLEVVVERIDDQAYWRRRCDLSWDLSKVVDRTNYKICNSVTSYRTSF